MANDIAPGGQLTTTADVENLHGFPEGILGIDIIDKSRKQSERFGTEIFTEKVTKFDFSSRPFKLFTDSRTVLADAVISTGTAVLKRIWRRRWWFMEPRDIGMCCMRRRRSDL